MKHINRIIIYNIIRDFKQVSGGIIPDNKLFVFIGFKQLFMERMPHGIANIVRRYAMLKGGIIVFDIRKHTISLWKPYKHYKG